MKLGLRVEEVFGLHWFEHIIYTSVNKFTCKALFICHS